MELTGKRLAGKYEIQSELGRGGMGVVYRGYDHELRRTVAVKVLSTQLASFPDFVQRFRHEAVAAANLHHANIVTIYDVGRDRSESGQPDIHFLVMQCIEGETLDQWMRRQRRAMSLSETDQIVHQVAAALQFAHDRGMVHRDVKPSNIMLSSNQHVTLMDFGLVRAAEMSTVTQTGTVLGTPLYMAPEQITGAQIDRRADIYSLGVVVYELLAGEAPFMRTTPLAVAHAHVYDPPPPLRKKRPDVSPVVESVVLKALVKEPSGRYPDAHSMAMEFSRAATGLPAARVGGVAPTLDFDGAKGKPPPVLPGGRPDKRGRSPLIWIASIVGLLLVAAIVVAFLRNESPATGGSELPIVEPAVSATPTTVLEDATEVATSTPSPTAVSQPTTPPRAILPTEAPTSTPIPDPPTATPVRDPTARVAGSSTVNVRSGPGTDYARVGEVRGGETFTIVGRNSDSTWWQICCVAGDPAWIAASLVQVTGALEGVSLVEVSAPTSTTSPPDTGVVSEVIPVSLQGASNDSTTYGYINPPLGNITLGGVRFDLGQGNSVTTQASSLPNNPTRATLPVNIDSPETIYLLLTGGNLFAEFNGRNVGTVRLLFDNGQESTVDLVAGRNVREWKQFDQTVVQSTSSPDVVEVWRGATNDEGRVGVIDMLRIPVPSNLRTRRLTGIELIDSSSQLVGDMDPALNLVGVSVVANKRIATVTPIPPTATPVPTACVLTPGPSFAQKWNRQRMGCPTGSETGITSAYETFERGWMLWRKDNDGLYAVLDGGDYSDFYYPPDDPPQFSCDEAQQLDRPQRGFSMVWCWNPDVRARIGNALDYEVGNDRPMQSFERGFMVYVEERGHVYAIYNDHTWQQVD
ncbi:MAG: protein kinase [Anaerolineae bacterium]|nr:protein kinase [Anaerolineae bacterium]